MKQSGLQAEVKKQRQQLREWLESELPKIEPWEPEKSWRSPFFDLVRTIKRWAPVRDLDAESAWAMICGIFSISELFEFDSNLISEDDLEVQFKSTWDDVRFAEGEDLLARALQKSKKTQIRLTYDRGQGYRRFIALVGALAGMVTELGERDKPVIALPQQRWAEVLKVNRGTIAVWTKWAVLDGFMRLHQDASYGRSQARQFEVIAWKEIE